jgi:imidazolonepropionase-like amidohydrolase
MMKERGTYLVPTIATVIDLIDPGGDYDNPILSMRGKAMLPRVREMTAHAWKMGIKIVAGTDTGYLPQSTRRVPDEIAELVGLGMPIMDAIKAGTSLSAECLGIEKRTGSIRPGLEADLIVVDRNPLEDVNALRDVLFVMNNGKIFVNRLDLK